MTVKELKYSVTGVLMLALMAACDMEQDINVQLPPHEENLVVECYLEPGENYQALVTNSVNFFEGKWLEGLNGAEVIISSVDEDRILTNLNITDTLHYKVFNYFYPDEVVYEEGKEYQITVKYEGEVKASGKTRFLPKVAIENVYFRQNADSLLATYVEIADNPAEENYYKVVLKMAGDWTGTNYEEVWDDTGAKNGTLTVSTAHFLPPGGDVVVNVYHIDKQYYEFLKSVQLAREANYNPFMQPAKIQSTLDGAVGVFSAVSLTSDTVQRKDNTL